MPPAVDRFCQQCGEKLLGRSNKKFCDDACRSLHHYTANNSPINYVRNVTNTLRRNRRILEEFIPDGKPLRVHRERLLQKGFDFNYHTHVSRTTTGNNYVFCFEYGYLPLENDWYTVVLRTEYLERSGDLPRRKE